MQYFMLEADRRTQGVVSSHGAKNQNVIRKHTGILDIPFNYKLQLGADDCCASLKENR